MSVKAFFRKITGHRQFSRVLMIISALCLLLLFALPLWRITLIAPQYPDGVTMYIWINKIGGETPAVLQNINILNHYVGMKYIEPDSIPELKYFPFIVVGLSVLGLLAALINRKNVFLAWVIVVVALAALGIYDFYLWEYDYGHNLSDTAPIKVPGASYQPPVLGTKNILNFIAQSYPHSGGLAAGVSIVLGLCAYLFKRKSQQHEASSDRNVGHAGRVMQHIA